MITLELLGAISILICVYLTAIQNVWCWIIGILGSLIYSFIFFSSNLYGESFLQIIFIIQGFYGWYYWGKDRILYTPLLVSKLGSVSLMKHLMLVIVILNGLLYLTPLGFLDSIITLLSLLATYYLTKKYLESWYLWILVDILSIGLYISRELYISSVLYCILLVLAINGLFKWKKSLKIV